MLPGPLLCPTLISLFFFTFHRPPLAPTPTPAAAAAAGCSEPYKFLESQMVVLVIALGLGFDLGLGLANYTRPFPSFQSIGGVAGVLFTAKIHFYSTPEKLDAQQAVQCTTVGRSLFFAGSPSHRDETSNESEDVCGSLFCCTSWNHCQPGRGEGTRFSLSPCTQYGTSCCLIFFGSFSMEHLRLGPPHFAAFNLDPLESVLVRSALIDWC
ncbi:hypothetical protein EX30DRAFT_112920 [Ascodesmis nigricans]|uniref:Uncharacterized protein n=1 Tax=Ascodesmis nigricans TaxID=341454 RepID=A0A4V3SIB4_9PEZI|nr:hypothetical protein EX30DRAFT_112920 [Ascodesmis nigricans]